MPGGTRSQRPDLVSPFTPSANRTTNRPPKKARIPTKKAVDAAKQLEDRRFQREQFKLAEEARHAARGAHHHSSVEGRQLRAEYSIHLERERDTAERVHAQKEKEAREWSAEVAQFGEDEARRRRDEEVRVMREQDELPTSELEDLQTQDELANPNIIVATHIRVNKELLIQDSLAPVKLDTFDIAKYEQHVISEFKKKNGYSDGWELQKRTAFVKARHPRATRTPQTLDDLSIEEWDKVFSIIYDHSARFCRDVDIKVELIYNAPKMTKESRKRARDMLSSDPIELSDTPRQNKGTRTEKLLAKARNQAESLRGAQAETLNLLRRWQCHDEQCINQNGFCFIDYQCKHYIFTSKEQLQWALAIERQEQNVSVEQPPDYMYRAWTGFNGPVTQTSRRSTQYQERQEAQAERGEAKDFMADYMEFNKQTMKMAMADKMNEQAERMTRRKTSPPLQAWQQQQGLRVLSCQNWRGTLAGRIGCLGRQLGDSIRNL